MAIFNFKRRPSSIANLVRNEGVPALGSYVETGGNINPIGYYKPEKNKYIELWTAYDLQQVCSRFKWKNLPNGLTSWNLERMLYYRGSLCGFYFNSKLYILPYTVSGGINLYGMPTKITPITYNGQSAGDGELFFEKDFYLNVDTYGDENNNYDAVLLYDNIPLGPNGTNVPRAYYNSIIINEIADTLARVNINIVVSNKKILLKILDPKQRKIVEKELSIAFGSDSPFAIITGDIDSSSIQSTNDFNAEELFNAVKNYDAIRCFINGISSKSFGSEKKERLVTGELAGATEEKELIIDSAFEMRKLFCDLVNKKFGTNISVEKRTDDYKEDTDGNNKTEVEKGLQI